MRDLERIREQDPQDGRARQWGVWALAALTTTALVVALGMMVGGRSAADKPQDDPLAALEGLEADEAGGDDARVERKDLTFPQTLVNDADERPEVAATVAAAEAELNHPPAVDGLGRPPRREEEDSRDDDARPLPTSVPAAAAAAPSSTMLTRTVRDDPLMDASSNDDQAPAPRPAARGQDGKYTLQVISYRTKEEARLFAETLRERGHETFVVRADLPDRGTYWRVRIGPFDSKRDAQAYRSDFEEAEGMNTYVVKRAD
ncbi:MAG: SPOR domain-containing protein [Myxococcota bacterium]